MRPMQMRPLRLCENCKWFLQYYRQEADGTFVKVPVGQCVQQDEVFIIFKTFCAHYELDYEKDK